MHKSAKLLVVTLLSAGLTACSGTQTTVNDPLENSPSSSSQSGLANQTIKPANSSAVGTQSELTLEQIMADPDWIGREPESAFWGLDANTLYYSQKRAGTIVKDLFSLNLTTNEVNQVPLAQLHQASIKDRVFDHQKKWTAWIFENNVFVQNLNTQKTKQLTRDQDRVSKLQFLQDGRISYQKSDAIYAVDIESGMTAQLVSWKFAEAPTAVEAPKDYIAEQQLDLIKVLRQRRQRQTDQFEQQQQLQASNGTLANESFYLPTKHRTVEASLSPNGRYAIVAIEEEKPSRDEGDIMPNYVVDNGRIKAESVRRRVADAKPESQYLWLLDLVNGSQKQLSYTNLPRYNDDVLASVKKENAQAKGETYQPNRLPRDIGLLVDWGWSQSAIAWHNDGEQVAIMLEAWDNKDRWLTTVDLNKKTLVTQHRLHDDAWVNYNFNSFGWLNNETTLYFLSEHSGYSHLYLKPLNGSVRALTQGRYEVDNLTLTADDAYIYYQANQKHPGIYEIYRVNVSDGKIDMLTDLNGKTDYVLSDDATQLLLTHSKLTQPPELYVKAVGSTELAKQVTFTTSEAFKAINWTAPEIVPIKSSHVDQPIYSRVYLPKNHDQGEKRRAVVFNHGAGYLQNSHLGWSGYFREFMFHNMLVQQGYVVLDMDYRASAGYGRDWRTAIYRHMGKPETQDLVDGVDWLVENVNVDRQRIGTYGGSYGGFMTFMALFTEPDLFQAGAALRPVSDWAHYNHGYTSNILNIPDVDPIAYERSSPIYFAEGLTKPLLINAPMVDNNVFFVDVVRLVQRLIELEKENFETAIYPVEAHGFIEPSSWLDEYRRIYKLFEQNL
ncbi:S9 family peptidase [Aliiglaciecola litoralis]|uniref:Prolyl oligopeptidase family serine peptidase n=1 Tax=Aliiglaciecola litoralis TaxID=582857 RepID=A0ABN1LBL5_9ALTE